MMLKTEYLQEVDNEHDEKTCSVDAHVGIRICFQRLDRLAKAYQQ